MAGGVSIDVGEKPLSWNMKLEKWNPNMCGSRNCSWVQIKCLKNGGQLFPHQTSAVFGWQVWDAPISENHIWTNCRHSDNCVNHRKPMKH
jgi:hypothetical protein